MVRTECSPARNAIAKYIFPCGLCSSSRWSWSLQFKPLVIQHLLCSWKLCFFMLVSLCHGCHMLPWPDWKIHRGRLTRGDPPWEAFLVPPVRFQNRVHPGSLKGKELDTQWVLKFRRVKPVEHHVWMANWRNSKPSLSQPKWFWQSYSANPENACDTCTCGLRKLDHSHDTTD